MTTKLIALLFIVAFLWGGWELFFYWEKVKNEQETEKKQAATALSGDQLAGVPLQLEVSLKAAQSQGAAGLQNWLKNYGRGIQDPRKAWIELDYCMLISRDNPNEAKRLFAEIKARTPAGSPIWPRIRQLEQTYQ